MWIFDFNERAAMYAIITVALMFVVSAGLITYSGGIVMLLTSD
jgi:hypothetical protein